MPVSSDHVPGGSGRLLRALTAWLIVVWSVGWGTGSAMTLRDLPGPGVSLFAFTGARTGALLAAAALVLSVALLLNRPRARQITIAVLSLVAAHRVVFVLTPAAMIVVQSVLPLERSLRGTGALTAIGTVLPEVVCVGVLIWALAGRLGRPNAGRADAVVTLALLVLVAREGLRGVLLLADIHALRQAWTSGADMWLYAGVLLTGIVTAAGALLLGAVRALGVRRIVPPLVALLVLSALRLAGLAALTAEAGGTSAGWVSATSLIAERGLLIGFAVYATRTRA